MAASDPVAGPEPRCAAQDAATGTRRFASSIDAIPEPMEPSENDVVDQVPVHGRHRTEPLRNKWLITLFAKKDSKPAS